MHIEDNSYSNRYYKEIIGSLEKHLIFMNEVVSNTSEPIKASIPEIIQKSQNLLSDIEYFFAKFDEEELRSLNNYNFYIPIFTRLINLGQYEDILIKFDKSINDDTYKYYLKYLDEFRDIFSEIHRYIINYKALENFNRDFLDNKIREVQEKIQNIDAARLALEYHETDKIYLAAASRYRSQSNMYELLFYITIVSGTLIALITTSSASQNFEKNLAIYVLIRLIVFSAVITLSAVFLRRSSHLRKLEERAFQTHLEITAFPLFVRSLEEQHQQELIKALASKYFGNEADQSQTDKIGDLIQDQLSASAEMVKASAELVKSFKP